MFLLGPHAQKNWQSIPQATHISQPCWLFLLAQITQAYVKKRFGKKNKNNEDVGFIFLNVIENLSRFLKEFAKL